MEESEISRLIDDPKFTQPWHKAVEFAIASVVISELLTEEETRSKLWMPLTRKIVEKCKDPSSAEFSAMMSFVLEAVIKTESYECTSLPMEIILAGLRESVKHFERPYFTAVASLYDPTREDGKPTTQAELKRVFGDLNVTQEGLGEFYNTELTAKMKLTISAFTVPQSIPGLGMMIADIHRPMTDLQGVWQTLNELRPRETKSFELEPPKWKQIENQDPAIRRMLIPAALEEYRTQTKKWFEELCAYMSIRVRIINIAHRLENYSSLIKYNSRAMTEDDKFRGKIVTKEMIEAMNPYTIPPLELNQEMCYDPSTPSITFGKGGPMFAFLDYRYGSERYLLLKRSSEVVPIEPNEDIESLGSKPSSIPWRPILRIAKHNIFVTKYFDALPIGYAPDEEAKKHEEDERYYVHLPAIGMIMPVDDLLLRVPDVVSVYRDHVVQHIKNYVAVIDTFREKIEKRPRSEKRIREVALVVYERKIMDAVRKDIIVDITPFSRESTSYTEVLMFEHKFRGS